MSNDKINDINTYGGEYVLIFSVGAAEQRLLSERGL